MSGEQSRADRLRDRRSDRSDTDDAADPSEEGDTSDQSDRSDSSEPSETSDWSDGTLKDVGTELRMYLPDETVKDLDYHFTGLKREIKHEHDEEIEKNRHFYPIVVAEGLSTVEGMSPDEFLALLRERKMI